MVSTINCDQDPEKVYTDVKEVMGEHLKPAEDKKAKTGENCLK